MEKVNSPDTQKSWASDVLDGLIQPGFPVKMFTCLFFETSANNFLFRRDIQYLRLFETLFRPINKSFKTQEWK